MKVEVAVAEAVTVAIAVAVADMVAVAVAEDVAVFVGAHVHTPVKQKPSVGQARLFVHTVLSAAFEYAVVLSAGRQILHSVTPLVWPVACGAVGVPAM